MKTEMTIPKAAMPVVAILRRDVPKPTARLVKNGRSPRFECGKCPQGLHETATNPTPTNGFTNGSAMLKEARAFNREAFVVFWDSLTLPQARKVIDLIWPVLLILICSITVSAQSPTQEKPARTETTQAQTGGQKIVLPKQKRLRFDYGDLVYLAGSVADVASSIGRREGNPVLRNSQGGLSVGKALAMKGAVYGAIKAVEAFYPDRPKVTMWFKVAVGCAWGAVAVHNVRVRQ